nr:MAG TPA: hypothetical protein [Caudoviricetes sp.]
MARKLTAYERERNRIKRLERKLKKQGVQYVPTGIPTLRQIKAKGFTGKSLRAYVNKLKKIDIEALKAEAYIPHEEDISFNNFDDEFLSKYGSFTPEEEDLFYGYQSASDEQIEQERKRKEAEYQRATNDLLASLKQPVEADRTRRREAINYSKNMQSFIVNLVNEVGALEVGRRLVEATRSVDDINVIISAVLWGSSVAVVNQATDELLAIINGAPLSFEEKVQAEVMNEVENGW